MQRSSARTGEKDESIEDEDDSNEEFDTFPMPQLALHLRERGKTIHQNRMELKCGKISRSNSAHIVINLPSKPREQVVGAADNAILLEAVLAQWSHHVVARGFRHWKHLNLLATDPSRFEDRNLNDEARRILRTADTARQAIMKAEEITDTVDDTQIEPAPPSVRIERNDLDLLLVWSKQTQNKTFGLVDEGSTAEVLRNLRFQVYENGDVLFYEGELGEMFYIVFKGTIAVFVGMPAPTSQRLGTHRHDNRNLHLPSSEIGKRVFAYHTGESLGETAMFTDGAVRSASAVAIGRCEVCELHRDVYRRTLLPFHEQSFECARKLNFLQRVNIFSDWTRERLAPIAVLLEKRQLHFGDTLFVERASILSGCFFVLSGTVKLSKLATLETPRVTVEQMILSCGTTNTHSRQPKKTHHVDLQVVSNDEVVGLEGLLDPNQHASYTATAASASVELYSLRECDARSIMGVPQSSFFQRLRTICNAAVRQRDTIVSNTKQTLMKQKETLSEDYDQSQTHHSLSTSECAIRSPELISPEKCTAPARVETVKPTLINEGIAPYLPHLNTPKVFDSCHQSARTDKLLMLNSTSPRPTQEVLGSFSSPKMLSFTVRNFIFSNWDTLENDYIDRTSRQFPVASTASVQERPTLSHDRNCFQIARETRRNNASFEQQTILDQQLARMHDSKIHWDTKSHKLLLQVPTPPGNHTLREAPVICGEQSLHATDKPKVYHPQGRSNGGRRLLHRGKKQQSGAGGSAPTYTHVLPNS